MTAYQGDGLGLARVGEERVNRPQFRLLLELDVGVDGDLAPVEPRVVGVDHLDQPSPLHCPEKSGQMALRVDGSAHGEPFGEVDVQAFLVDPRVWVFRQVKTPVGVVRCGEKDLITSTARSQSSGGSRSGFSELSKNASVIMSRTRATAASRRPWKVPFSSSSGDRRIHLDLDDAVFDHAVDGVVDLGRVEHALVAETRRGASWTRSHLTASRTW